jgi:NADH-ubiquinone oxidoreductase chain 2
MSLLLSSLLSLLIGTILGLTQFRIKRLYAFSTISHIGFILLALTIDSTESIESFMFYLMQYSISNLNAFILIITIGYILYFYIYKIEHNKKIKNDNKINYKDEEKIYENNSEIINKIKINVTTNENDSNNNLKDINNSPIQLIDQLKGFYHVNPLLSLSIAITLFSFAGIPPAIGFFGKQMVLSAALDNGYIFISLVAILTSVISTVYYLIVVKQIFFYIPDFILNPKLNNFMANGIVFEKHIIIKKIGITVKNIVISSSLSLPISILTLIIKLFIFIPQE